jgi:hypothetical protein
MSIKKQFHDKKQSKLMRHVAQLLVRQDNTLSQKKALLQTKADLKGSLTKCFSELAKRDTKQ